MKLDRIAKLKRKENKRVGRGIASGKGKTSGRGTKGQKARGTIPATFTGSLAFYKKLPLRRGKGNNAGRIKKVLITLEDLNIFKANTVVDAAKLLEGKIITAKDSKKGIKVLAVGEVKNILTVKLPASKAARQKIEKAGGKVENV